MIPFDKLYLYTAIAGAVLFVLTSALQFFSGGDGEVDLDGGFDGADISFKFLSMQGISSFGMMFGLVGLAGHESNLHGGLTFGLAVVSGVATLFIMRSLFRFFASLQSTGNLNLRLALNQVGSVYLTIPAGGQGKVQVQIDGRLLVLNAVSEDGYDITTGMNVRIVGIDGDSILRVIKHS